VNTLMTALGNAIWSRLEPKLDKQLAEWRKDVMTMLSEALPEMAGAVAEQAVKTVFENTEVDEAADAVSGVITDIVNRLPRFPFLR
jgi:hypothetical protein